MLETNALVPFFADVSLSLVIHYNAVLNLGIFVFRHDVPRHELMGVGKGALGDDPVGFL
jgi:hypothetical protein